jgi:predicted NAD-dependent protein-ADP-ribosyltransferase YbiA (DUF1768 family)
MQSKFSRASYPTSWFAKVSDSQAPDWEILPQAAGENEVILSKRNELGLLSNFAVTPFVFQNQTYQSVEGFWQMMKYPEHTQDERLANTSVIWPHSRFEVSQMSGSQAKHAGDHASLNMKELKIDWVSMDGEKFKYRSSLPGRHYELIREAMWQKLLQNDKVKQVLIATGDLILKPDHWQEPTEPPEWRYFDIWMEFRKILTKKAI